MRFVFGTGMPDGTPISGQRAKATAAAYSKTRPSSTQGQKGRAANSSFVKQRAEIANELDRLTALQNQALNVRQELSGRLHELDSALSRLEAKRADLASQHKRLERDRLLLEAELASRKDYLDEMDKCKAQLDAIDACLAAQGKGDLAGAGSQ